MITKYKFKQLVHTYVKFIKISPIKVKRILNYIRNKTYKEALICLEFMPYKACFYIWQLLFNLITNIKKKDKNRSNILVINKAIVYKGPISKKIRFISRGRCSIIKKKTCHIRLGIGII